MHFSHCPGEPPTWLFNHSGGTIGKIWCTFTYTHAHMHVHTCIGQRRCTCTCSSAVQRNTPALADAVCVRRKAIREVLSLSTGELFSRHFSFAFAVTVTLGGRRGIVSLANPAR